MKRFKIIPFLFLSVLLFCAALFSACAQETAAEPSLREKLDRSIQSSRMTCSATLFNGEFTLAEEIAVYTRGDNGYWQWLDGEMREYAKQIGLDYVTNDDSMRRPFDAPPVIVNYFYHSQIKKSAQKR